MKEILKTWWSNYLTKRETKDKAEVWGKVCRRIRMKDYEYQGKTVVALLVDGTMVEYVCEYPDLDPEGFPFTGSINNLMRKMNEIRQEEFNRYWRERGM